MVYGSTNITPSAGPPPVESQIQVGVRVALGIDVTALWLSLHFISLIARYFIPNQSIANI